MENQPQEQMSSENANKQIFKFIGGILAGLCLLLVILLVLDSLHIISLQSIVSRKTIFDVQKTGGNFSNSEGNNAISTTESANKIVKVGEETVYQKDLETELQYSPVATDDSKKLLLDKIIKDSIILQAGRKGGLVALDSSIYNSLDKDYMKRIKTVAEIRQKIENNRDSISGHVVSVWFSNNGPWKLPYETAKEIAFKKITYLHQEVEAKRMTIQQAGEEIKKDASLFDVDRAYKTNALYSFNQDSNEDITYDPDFDEILRNLPIHQVSAIYTGKDIEIKDGKKTGNKIEVLYMFGVITDKKSASGYASFDAWFEKQKNEYEISRY